jgi:3-oxoacid CoA-transferase subunit B
MILTGLANDVTVDEIKAKTGADFEVDLARQSAAA